MLHFSHLTTLSLINCKHIMGLQHLLFYCITLKFNKPLNFSFLLHTTPASDWLTSTWHSSTLWSTSSLATDTSPATPRTHSSKTWADPRHWPVSKHTTDRDGLETTMNTFPDLSGSTNNIYAPFPTHNCPKHSVKVQPSQDLHNLPPMPPLPPHID